MIEVSQSNRKRLEDDDLRLLGGVSVAVAETDLEARMTLLGKLWSDVRRAIETTREVRDATRQDALEAYHIEDAA